MKSHIFAALAISLIAFGCDSGSSGVPQSSAAKKMGDAPKQTVDKVVNEANKAIEQGEARTREAIDGNK